MEANWRQIPTLEKRKDGNDTGRGDVDGKLVLPDRKLLDVLRQTSHYPGTVTVKVVGLALVLIGRVDDGSLEGSDMVAGRLSHVRRVFGDCDILTGGRGEEAQSLLIAAQG